MSQSLPSALMAPLTEFLALWIVVIHMEGFQAVTISFKYLYCFDFFFNPARRQREATIPLQSNALFFS